MNPFRKEQAIWINNVETRVVRQIGEYDVQLENCKSGEITTHKIFNLLEQYLRGEVLTAAQRRHQVAKEGKEGKKLSPSRMDHLSESARHETRRRMDYVTRLGEMGSFNKSRKGLRSDLTLVAAYRNEARVPHVSTVYRWRRKYLLAQRDVRALICEFDKQGGKGKARLDPEVEGIILDKIESIFLAQKRSDASEVHSAVLLEVAQRNTQKIESEWLPVPGLRTIQRRLSELYAFELAIARFGEREAERRFAHHLGARSVTRILELVEIDHSPVDILVTDEKGIVIGRPMITVVLDRKSRCVLGYHLSLAGHGTQAVFAALRHALLPKLYLQQRYADLDLEWDCFGWFECLLMDNGREFHAEAVIDALMNLSIATEFARSKTPNDKPHVERFLKTFNYCFIHRLPGTTLAKVHLRIGFKAEDDACITLAELDRMIHVWICKVYHLRPHAGLAGRAPMTVWKEGAAAFPPQLKANNEDLDIELARCDTSSLQHYGIDLNTFVYVSPRLLTLRRMLPPQARVKVKWPEYDAGHIFVWDPHQEEYFKVENKDRLYLGLTVEQAKQTKKAKAAADPTSQVAIASGEALAREMAQAALAGKSLKQRKKGARFDNQTSEKLRRPHPKQPRDEVCETDPVLVEATPAAALAQVPEIEMEWVGAES